MPGEIPHRAERHAVVAGLGHKAKVQRVRPVAHLGTPRPCIVAFSAQTALKSHRRGSSAKKKNREDPRNCGKEGGGMLILTRRVGETVMIGDDVTITVLGVKGNQVRVGINAPRNVGVHREEIYERIKREQRQAAREGEAPGPVPSFAPAGVVR